MHYLSKHLTSQRFVFKINTSRLRRSNWNLTLSISEARENKELIALSESQLLRFIDEINGVINPEDYIKQLKLQINHLKYDKDIVKSRSKIKKIYTDLDKLQFKKDYVCVVINSKKDYYKIYKDGFKINDITYRRLLGTSGGIKNNTIVFVNENLIAELERRIDNGRDLSKEFIPAKLEAYKSLVCSSSTPVSWPSGIAVVHDCITHFKTDVIELDYDGLEEPSMKYIQDKEIELDNSDGYGMAMPELMEQWGMDIGEDFLLPACVIRNSFCKGAVFPVDFRKFAHDNGLSKIVDVWGNEHNIDEIDLVLTESMLKLWDSYSSIDDYIENCKNNHYTFSITKSSEQNLENVRSMNYQFLQSYEFTDEQIDELIGPTVSEINDILSNDYRKTILYLNGTELNDDNIQRNITPSIATAVMIEPELIKDSYVRSYINSMIKKRMDDAKIGVLDVPANYSFVSGDPYSLCQSMFGLEVTGLLKAGQVYSKYWIDHGVSQITSFRAPMTAHNNIKLLDVVHDEKMGEFYKYMTTPTIFNSWDTCTMAMNGMDMDGDCVINTSMKVIVNNTRKLPAISCVQRKGIKCVPSHDDFIKSNIASFGNNIGKITNKITSMFEVQANYNKDSREYRILDYRIKCGQLLQQDEIDKVKGIVAKGMPDTWTSWISNKVSENDSSKDKKKKWFNRKIVVDKKPYFMKYIYPAENRKYLDYIRDNNEKCLMLFRVTLNELISKSNKTHDEQIFIDNYYKRIPLGEAPCTMNRICKRVEDVFDNISLKQSVLNFDYASLRDDEFEYSYRLYRSIKIIYERYKKELNEFVKKSSVDKVSKEERIKFKSTLDNDFKRQCLCQCSNINYLYNILLDLCYSGSYTDKKFLWEMCGELIVKKLLERTGYKINYPIHDEHGDIEFNGQRFSMKEAELTDGWWCSDTCFK